MFIEKGGIIMLFLDTCADLWPIINLIKNGLIPLIQIGIPIILIVLGMFDLGKAVVASKEDEIKNAQKLLIKRFVYAVAIFFVVFIVTVLFNLVADTGNGQGDTPNATNWKNCWNCNGTVVKDGKTVCKG